MNYQPGTHLIATLISSDDAKLRVYHSFKQFLDTLIDQHRLKRLGEVYHDFSPAGFTGVACLSESHISIHTWPEFNKINIDIYLSNYQRQNDGTVSDIFDSLVQWFDATVQAETKIRR
jgi:S-adenosylmethionine decarboxylase